MNTTQRKARSLTADLITFGSLVGGANGALVYTFSQAGDDVVMTSSGSVSATSASWTDDSIDFLSNAGMSNNSIDNRVTGAVYEAFSGTTSFAGSLSTTVATADFATGGAFTSAWAGGTFIMAMSGGVEDNSAPSGTFVFTPNVTMTWENSSYADIGIDHHPTNTLINLAQFDVAGSDGQVQFLVNAVPEPSSALLLGLSSLGLAFRRSGR